MPEEVMKWCDNNKTKLKFFDGYDNLIRWKVFENPYADIHFGDILCLPEDFKLEEKAKGKWVEFDIDKNGDFDVCGIANDENITITYNWTQWNNPIRDNASKNFINGCRAFGGWQYEDSKRWYLAPAVKLQDGEMWNSYVIEESGEAIPVIPVKIRFWRETK
jgi:hypothetical protein